MVYFNEWVMPPFNKNPLQISEQGVRQTFRSYRQQQHMTNSEWGEKSLLVSANISMLVFMQLSREQKPSVHNPSSDQYSCNYLFRRV
jgi:hypothetical protein